MYFRCKICNTPFSNTGNLEEHIGIKHLGFKDGKDWRKNKPANKHLVKQHEAYEYTPYSEIRDREHSTTHEPPPKEEIILATHNEPNLETKLVQDDITKESFMVISKGVI